MGSSLVKIDVHVMFHVKNNDLVIKEKDLPRIFKFIGGLIRNMDAIPLEVGGICNHIHILASLPKTKSVSSFVKDVKSFSSRWIKTIDKYYNNFAWQDGYSAFSVGYNGLDRVIRYIQNQKQHHAKQSSQDELKWFLDCHNISYDERYVFK